MAFSDNFDRATGEIAALRLQLEEINQYRAYLRPFPDQMLALDTLEAETRRAIDAAEARLADSIRNAVDSDAMVVDEARDMKRLSSQNRDANVDESLPTREQRASSVASSSLSCEMDLSFGTQSTASATDGRMTNPMTNVAGPNTAVQEETVEQNHPPHVQCSCCTEYVDPQLTVRLACNDIYCKPCLKGFFMRVTQDESLFPPRCCRQPVELSLVEADLSEEELAIYRNAELEFSSSSRVYCANPVCAKFIPPAQRSRDTARCAACSLDTCMHCKARTHPGTACPEDTEAQRLIKFANEKGWQTCSSCGRVLSRSSGCDHMTCPCGHHFCYVCGTEWKRCNCDGWNPAIPNHGAGQNADRRQDPVARLAQELGDNFECRHLGVFQRRQAPRSGAQCELCGVWHYRFYLRCRDCQLDVCEDCRRYRLH